MAISKIKVGTTEHELQTTIANVTNLQSSLDAKTSTSVIPNNSGEIKTKYRIAQKGYTSGATWYYKVCDFPTNNSGNYASAIISGRIGGWTSDSMSYVNALVWNRGTPGVALIDIAGDASATSSIWNIADLVLYTNGTSATAANTATLYVKCKNYFTFDLDLELFQSSGSITYDGSYITTTPSGTLAAQSSTTTKRVEVINGKMYVAGSQLAFSSHTHDGLYETIANAADKLTTAKTYTDTACTTLKNDLLNGAGAAYDTLKELGDLIDENTDAIEALETVAAGKANASHTHSAATTSAAGFMSASDKSKLDGITASADSVSFSRSLTSGTKVGTITINGTGTDLYAPTNTDTTYGVATSSSLGLVKSGTDITVDSSGNVSVKDDSHNHVISNIDNLQSSLDAKQATVTGAATTITSNNLTTSRALISNSSGKVAVSDVTSTELNYLDGVTSNIQSQLNNKIPQGTSSFEMNSGGSLKGYGGFIDFHYHDSSGNPTNASGTVVTATPDYTSRIIENAAGQIDINNVKMKSGVITGTLSGNATTATTATTATKLGSSTVGGTAKPIYLNGGTATACSSTVGSATQPVYMNGGTVTACTYTLGKSVPSNAVFTDTTYSAATTSAAGLMSASDKSKLDGIASGANAYSLPTATSSTLGGVKVGSNITVSSGTISLTKANVTSALGYTPPTTSTNTTYSLSLSDCTITLTGSDGSTSSITLPTYDGTVEWE